MSDDIKRLSRLPGEVIDVTDNDKLDQGVQLMMALNRELNDKTLEYLKAVKKADVIKFVLGVLAGQVTFLVYIIIDFLEGKTIG